MDRYINKNVKVLAIETSCDETAIAFTSLNGGQYTVLGQSLYSQIDIHKEFGGVFPMMAKREHGKNLVHLLEELFHEVQDKKTIDFIDQTQSVNNKDKALSCLERESELLEIFKTHLENNDGCFYKKPDIDAIAVTVGPGLEPALWVGISFAKALSILWNIPLLPINHMEGHVVSVLASDKVQTDLFPALALLISGGHTELVSIQSWGDYSIIGGTKDDAVGEAYDKVARILGMPYPGGPEISKRADALRAQYPLENLEQKSFSYGIRLPRPMLHSQDTNFSFSGLKTAVLYLVRDLKRQYNLNSQDTLSDEITSLICFEFEQAVVEVLIKKLQTAIDSRPETKTLVVGGGVIANTYIRKNLDTWSDTVGISIHKPASGLATDNAAMIGIAGLVRIAHTETKLIYPNTTEFEQLHARGGWRIDELY